MMSLRNAFRVVIFSVIQLSSFLVCMHWSTPRSPHLSLESRRSPNHWIWWLSWGWSRPKRKARGPLKALVQGGGEWLRRRRRKETPKYKNRNFGQLRSLCLLPQLHRLPRDVRFRSRSLSTIVHPNRPLRWQKRRNRKRITGRRYLLRMCVIGSEMFGLMRIPLLLQTPRRTGMVSRGYLGLGMACWARKCYFVK